MSSGMQSPWDYLLCKVLRGFALLREIDAKFVSRSAVGTFLSASYERLMGWARSELEFGSRDE